MRLAVAAAAFVVLGGAGVTYALMANKSAPPPKAPIVAKSPAIPKNETATLAFLSSPKNDQSAGFRLLPFHPPRFR